MQPAVQVVAEGAGTDEAGRYWLERLSMRMIGAMGKRLSVIGCRLSVIGCRLSVVPALRKLHRLILRGA